MSDTYEQLKLKNQLCFPLYACSRKIVNAYTPYLKPLGLTYTQYLVFMVLWEKKEASVGELGSTLCLDAGTLSPLLKKLEIEGLIARTHPEIDERVTNVKLTDRGEELKEKCKDIPFKVASVADSLNQKEIEQLYVLLYKILD
ncbi:MAG: MarR family transcriptional regulator [Lachnospiraceae bacterium]|nr:MarR family transcriptional regulator [Lachnospiraceae bacterium]